MFLTEQFKDINVRFLKAPNGEPVIIAADFVAALKGDKLNAADLVKKNVRAKWWIDLPNPNGGRPVRCLFEPGAYQLVGNSSFRTEFAEEFQDWLFEGVLPKLRASGGYIMPSATSEQLEALQAEIAALQKDKEELAGKVYYMEFGDAPDDSFDSFEYTVYKNARNFYRYASAYDSLTPRQKDAITDECDKKFPHPRVALQDKKSRKKYVEGNGLSLVKRW